MAKKIKIRCHPNKHENDVDVQKALHEDLVLSKKRGGGQ